MTWTTVTWTTVAPRSTGSMSTVKHTTHLEKQQKLISFEKAPAEQAVTEKQRTMLRGMVGVLQWPSTQSSPHLQAMTNQLAGMVSKATIGTLQEANKCLRFAKQYCDVGLKFDHLGSCKDLTFKILSLTVTQLLRQEPTSPHKVVNSF